MGINAQIQTFADTPVDLVSALTVAYVDEAVGIVRAAVRAGLPVVISFTVETDGRLPSGTTIEDAILQVDAATDRWPAYYMINCAHPTHFSAALHAGRRWPLRLRGIRANASQRSHAELDAAATLDDGDPVELAVVRLPAGWQAPSLPDGQFTTVVSSDLEVTVVCAQALVDDPAWTADALQVDVGWRRCCVRGHRRRSAPSWPRPRSSGAPCQSTRSAPGATGASARASPRRTTAPCWT